MKMSERKKLRDKFLINIFFFGGKNGGIEKICDCWSGEHDDENLMGINFLVDFQTTSHIICRVEREERSYKIILHGMAWHGGGRIPTINLVAVCSSFQQFAMLWLQIIYHDIMHENLQTSYILPIMIVIYATLFVIRLRKIFTKSSKQQQRAERN